MTCASQNVWSLAAGTMIGAFLTVAVIAAGLTWAYRKGVRGKW